MKIVTALLKYDYGIESRGESLEKKGFLPAIEKVVDEVMPFWLEDNGFYEDQSLLQKKLIKFVEKEQPDAIFFILMNDEITSETIIHLSKKYITINWFCDDQWRFDNYTKNIAPNFKYCITTDKYSLNKYYNIGCKNVILSQWASFQYLEIEKFNNIDYIYDISFVGGKNSTREWIINFLRKSGYTIECFGAGWENGRISYEEMKNIFLSTKININLSNSVNNDIRCIFNSTKNVFDFLRSSKRIEQIKARNFEIPCLGGFQLTNYIPGIEDYFEIGKEIAIYTTLEDLSLQIKYYLENDIKRLDMTIAANKRAKLYIYENIIRRVMNEITNNVWIMD